MQEAWKEKRGKSNEERSKAHRSREHRLTALEGEASRGRINATKCRNEFGGRPDVRIIACVSQQRDEWNNSHKGARILERLPNGEKKNWAQHGLAWTKACRSSPSLSFLSLAEY